MKENVIQTKSFEFAKKVIVFSRKQKWRDPVIVQLLRSATSVGANIEEAIGAISRKEFIMKATIAYKEARESLYWLRLLAETQKEDGAIINTLKSEATEIVKILNAILKTSKS